MAKNSILTRGNIAKKFNINPETLRYYEAQKLIKNPQRLHNNYRVYDKEDIASIHFILKAKQLEFTLKDIKVLLNLSLNPRSNREHVRKVVQEKSKMIAEKIKQLRKIQKALDQLFLLCKQNKEILECPILKVFTSL